MTSPLSQAIRLASGLDLRHDVSRQARGQLPTRPSVHKPSLFQSLAAPCFDVFCPEDFLKLRSNPRFDKGGKSDLSTFPPIICGHWWTTQRLVAFVLIRREPSQRCGVRFRLLWQAVLCENCATQLRLFINRSAIRITLAQIALANATRDHVGRAAVAEGRSI